MLVISALVAHSPKRTVSTLYHEASANWWAAKGLYEGPAGMNYLPHFAVLFSPFHLLPFALADILWRCTAAALLASGIWRLAKQQFGNDAMRAFLLASVLALPLCLGALRNGQANAMFAALTLQAVAALARAEWSKATIWMMLAFAIKPLGIVLVLLTPVCYAPMRWRVALGLIAVVVFPFLFQKGDYVLAQHRSFANNLQACAAVTEHRFADINGILRTFEAELPVRASKLIRAAACVITLGLWWFGARRLVEPRRALWLLALTAAYLMLFNPMNEANSYVIIAPAFGLWALTIATLRPEARTSWWIAAMALSMSCLPNLLRPFFGNLFALVWHPLMTIIFVSLLAVEIWRQTVSAPVTEPAIARCS